MAWKLCPDPAVLVELFNEITFLRYNTKQPNFINRLCLLPTLFSKMYFLFYVSAFDDVMKFENKKF